MRDQELHQACTYLRNSDPRLWDHFVKAFAAHTDQVTAKVIMADQSTILACQGQAQEAHSLLKFFREISAQSASQPATSR